MSTALGRFTVWYLPNTPGPIGGDRYAHDIQASNRADLMQQAKDRCPKGMLIKSIVWHYGGSRIMWYRVQGKSEAACWDADRCSLAFGR